MLTVDQILLINNSHCCLRLTSPIHLGLFVDLKGFTSISATVPWKHLRVCVNTRVKALTLVLLLSPFLAALTADPIPRLLFLWRIGRNWNMAADRPAHPSPYPWTHWGLQLERDLAAGISCLSNGKNRPVADESSGCPGAEGKPILHLMWTAQNHFAYFFSCLGVLQWDCVCQWEKGMIQEENKIHLLWTCLASMALEHCLPKVGTCCSRDYHPSSGCAWLKSLTLLPESCPYPQETCKSKDCVSNPTGDGTVSCIPFAS